jgi:uncharacterized membrane protein YheB (UPF0754 family)
MSSIQLSDEELKQAMHAAILKALGETGREAIIKHAVDYLTTAPRDGLRDQISPLLRIVREAAHEIARTTLKERLASDTAFVAQVQQLYADATAKLFAAETRDKLVERLSTMMADALTKDRY